MPPGFANHRLIYSTLVMKRLPRPLPHLRNRGCRASLPVLCVVLAGCSAPHPRIAADPLEPVNRAVYTFNDKVDRYVAKPVAQAYEAVLPQFLRTGVRNFFNNLDDINVVANDLLQLKFKEASRDGVRFVANTVFGGLGFVDVAGMRGIGKRQEDFGQTLGYWGVGPGPYLVIPFLGPSTVRDAAGRYADAQIDPVWRWDNVLARNTAAGIRIIDVRAGLLPTERVLDEAATDRYSFIRDAYLQRRLNLIYDGNVPRGRDDDALDDPGEGAIDDPVAVQKR